MTETYRASRTGAPPVALKLLRPDRGGADARVREAFVLTAQRNKGLRLSGVAKVTEVHQGGDGVFAITDLQSGVNLEGLFESATANGNLDPALVGQIGIQIARVLTRLHERREPVFHGGLCPGNVVVTSGGRVTLVDLGFTAALRPLTTLPIDKSWFAAPEIALEGAPPAVASDIYGLGALLYYLLTGEPPVMGESIEELAELFELGPPEMPGVPEWLQEAITTMLSRHPDDRPRSAAAAALCLNAFHDGATRLGAMVSGGVVPLGMTAPGVAAAVADPMALYGTMAMPSGAAVLPALAASSAQLPAVSGFSPLAEDEIASPFDGPDSGVGVRVVPAGGSPALAASNQQAWQPPRAEPAPSSGVRPSLLGPLTLTPLRPAAVLAVHESDPVTTGLGLANEPQWAVAVAPAYDPTSAGLRGPPASGAEPRWADAFGSALDNEPKWADGGVSLGAPARVSLPVDDFLDLGPPPSSGVFVAGVGLASSGKVELPDLLDVDDAAVPAFRTMGSAISSDASAPIGLVQFGGATGQAGTTAAIGAIAFGEEGDEPGVVTADTGNTGSFVLPQVPRRAGSARIGMPQPKRKRRAPLVLISLLLCGAGALMAMKMLDRPAQMLPTPEALAQQQAGKSEQPKAVEQKADQVEGPGRGELSIITTPQGATIWVDGTERGRTPVTVQTTPGAHRLVIIKPGFKMLREVADTSEGLTIKRTLPPANINFGGNVKLKVECKTAGKYPVFIDGKDTGLLCPIDNLKIPSGNRLIGVYVIPDNKVWSFEREVLLTPKGHRVVFSY